jgi:hypothetical protein
MSFEEGLDSITFPTNQEPPDLNRKIVEELFSTKQINLKTQLSDTEIKLMTRLKMIGIIFHIPQMKLLTGEFKELRVSDRRMGRLELVKALNNNQDENKQGRVEDLKRILGVNSR